MKKLTILNSNNLEVTEDSNSYFFSLDGQISEYNKSDFGQWEAASDFFETENIVSILVNVKDGYMFNTKIGNIENIPSQIKRTRLAIFEYIKTFLEDERIWVISYE